MSIEREPKNASNSYEIVVVVVVVVVVQTSS